MTTLCGRYRFLVALRCVLKFVFVTAQKFTQHPVATNMLTSLTKYLILMSWSVRIQRERCSKTGPNVHSYQNQEWCPWLRCSLETFGNNGV